MCCGRERIGIDDKLGEDMMPAAAGGDIDIEKKLLCTVGQSLRLEKMLLPNDKKQMV